MSKHFFLLLISIWTIVGSQCQSQLPVNYDWRNYISMSPIENQGVCHAFYAFTTATLAEAAYAIHEGIPNLSLSKQQIIDCTNSMNGDFGCAGGNVGTPFRYFMSHGVVEEKYYPYIGNDTQECYANDLLVREYRLSNYVSLPHNTTDEFIMNSIFTKGPVLAYIYSNFPAFRNYTGGILQSVYPNTVDFDHGVVILGWGTENDVDYWILRNSWGRQWGEEGTARVARHQNNLGLNNYVYYAVL